MSQRTTGSARMHRSNKYHQVPLEEGLSILLQLRHSTSESSFGRDRDRERGEGH